MAANIVSWTRKQPLIVFYILAFSIAWLGWMPQAAYSHGLFPFDSPIFYILGGVGPLLAVFITLKILHGEVDYGSVFRPLWQWQFGVVWYFVALFGYPAMWLLTLMLNGDVSTGLAKLGTPLSILSTFLLAFLAAIPEQIAWRGFALPRLQARYTALISSLIVGVLWALWHLPLLLNNDNVMSTYPFFLWSIDVVARSIIHTWIFNSTRGSLLFVTSFHAASNTAGSFVGLENVVVSLVVVAVLIIVFGATHLARGYNRPVQKDAHMVTVRAG
ncbi:MAG TPA: CPBP family intramembrane glutamic endopeptidase [Anaerolineales bacterium]|nr:CPBP family intramembrane glutamic endopeptidase [Anaerolineales bacterium]